MRALVAILALAACNPHRWPPDELCAHNERVYHHGDSTGAVCPVVDRAAACAQRACSAQDWSHLKDQLSNVDIDVRVPPLYCVGLVAGCQDGTDIQITSADVAYDELGHLTWEVCRGRTGESLRTTDQVPVYDEDFVEFVAGCREDP